ELLDTGDRAWKCGPHTAGPSYCGGVRMADLSQLTELCDVLREWVRGDGISQRGQFAGPGLIPPPDGNKGEGIWQRCQLLVEPNNRLLERALREAVEAVRRPQPVDPSSLLDEAWEWLAHDDAPGLVATYYGTEQKYKKPDGDAAGDPGNAAGRPND